MKNWHLAATLAAGLVYAASAHADEWKQELTPYLWGSNLQGSVTVGSVTAGVDLGFGDILDNLEMGFMASYRYIDTAYDSGSGASYFRYDVVTAGPALGLTVAF